MFMQFIMQTFKQLNAQKENNYFIRHLNTDLEKSAILLLKNKQFVPLISNVNSKNTTFIFTKYLNLNEK